MAVAGDNYIVEVLRPHTEWGTFRNETNREFIEGESYVKIPAEYARRYNIVRGNCYLAHFENGYPSIEIKAAGNGPCENGVQYAKQFEGIGSGACKAFTPWYKSCNIQPGDYVEVKFLSSTDIIFSKR